MADQLAAVFNPQTAVIIFPALGGFLPPLIWLFFWLKEDIHPEPKKRLIYTFLAGMFSVLVALFLEEMTYLAELKTGLAKTFLGTTITIALWAIIEEVVKYFAAYYGGLKRTDCDEPIDPPIYLITAALGFAAMENILFLVKIVQKANGLEFLPAFLTGNLRFLGANLLHVVTSAFVGISLSLCFFHKHNKRRNIMGGIFIASSLHFLFNYFIIKGEGNLSINEVIKIMLPLWAMVVAIIFILEKIKHIKTVKNKLIN